MIILMLSLVIFCSFHLFITLKNYTTYEYITKVIRQKKSDSNSLKELSEIVDESEVSMFDVGVYENFKQVYGGNLFYWFLPLTISNLFLKYLN